MEVIIFKIFRKDMAYDIKSHKKAGFQPLSRKQVLGKTAGRGVQLTSQFFLKSQKLTLLKRTLTYIILNFSLMIYSLKCKAYRMSHKEAV